MDEHTAGRQGTVTIVFAIDTVGVVASLLLAGHLSDVVGRRKVLLVTVGVLTARSAPALKLPLHPETNGGP